MAEMRTQLRTDKYYWYNRAFEHGENLFQVRNADQW